MTRGQLAQLPQGEGRRSQRLLVNFAASIREAGASVVDAEVQNLSVTGFMAETDMKVEIGARVFLKLPGMEPLGSEVRWIEDGKVGFEFTSPLHPATLDMLTSQQKKGMVKNHFGPGALANRR